MDAEWIMSVIEETGRIGRAKGGGICRPGFSPEDAEAFQYFISLIENAGLEGKIDAFGNISARLEGANPDAPAVATGSHIDTVPNGGLFDGVLGAASSLAAIARLKNEGARLSHPLELIIFRLEESSRFGCATMGSKVVSGRYSPGMWDGLEDRDGALLPEVMAKAGFDLNAAPAAARNPGEFKAFVELHLDQSGDLEKSGKPIGVAEAIAAPMRAKVVIKGEAAHSGTARMRERKDALVSAAEFILSVRNFAMAYADMGIRATVGSVDVYPGAINVVPGFARLYVDLRGTDKKIMDEVYGIIRSESSKIALRRGTPIEMTFLSEEYPVKMDTHVHSVIKSACSALGVECENIVSGAGHDAMNMSYLTPAGMIFVRGGASGGHRPDERASAEDVAAGLGVLTETLRRLAL